MPNTNTLTVTVSGVDVGYYDTVWMTWSSTTSSGTTNCIDECTWQTWKQTVTTGTTPRVITLVARNPVTETDAQRAARVAARMAEEKQNRLAKKRARVLLLTHLTVAQRRAMKRTGAFRVVSRSSGNAYLIETRYGQSRNVKRLGDAGQVISTLCAHPQAVQVPDEDAYLAQKLMLEHAEDEFLRIANVS